VHQGLLTRYIAYNILKKLRNKALSFKGVFSQYIKKYDLDNSDKKMIQNIVLNSMRNKINIEEILKIYIKKFEIDNNSYFLLLGAITQLIYLNFKPYAVINSSVELAKHPKIRAPKNFINAILRKIDKDKKKLLHVSGNYTKLPNWFKNKTKKWTVIDKLKFIKTISEEPNIHLVFKKKEDLNKINREIIKTSNNSGVLKKHESLIEIPDYKFGKWWVQDYSAMTPIMLLDKIKNKKVIDLCSAPGGKTFVLVNKGAKVTAVEKDNERINQLKDNLLRLNFNCNILNSDALKINEKNKYDIVILDAPCSSIGTIRRHPEIFYRKIFPNFNKLTLIQSKLLEKAKKLVNKKGEIIYMVCSFLKEEGEIQIKNFLKKNKNFRIEKFKITNNFKDLNNLIDKNGYFYTQPKKLSNGVLIDGFFAAKIINNDK
tara:strand:- start:17626 stop:18912 length:1287 start_codon:yes stop_codon:yes gene_type:complete